MLSVFSVSFFSEISSISGVPKSNVRVMSPCNLIALHGLHKNRLSVGRSTFYVQIYGLVAHYLARTSRIAGLPIKPNYSQLSFLMIMTQNENFRYPANKSLNQVRI